MKPPESVGQTETPAPLFTISKSCMCVVPVSSISATSTDRISAQWAFDDPTSTAATPFFTCLLLLLLLCCLPTPPVSLSMAHLAAIVARHLACLWPWPCLPFPCLSPSHRDRRCRFAWVLGQELAAGSTRCVPPRAPAGRSKGVRHKMGLQGVVRDAFLHKCDLQALADVLS